MKCIHKRIINSHYYFRSHLAEISFLDAKSTVIGIDNHELYDFTWSFILLVNISDYIDGSIR
jgi:hypothetical protein